MGRLGRLALAEVRALTLGRAFGCLLEGSLLGRWMDSGKRHLIGPVELYAVALARSHWRDVMADRKVVFYVDNMGALHSLIRGSSADPIWREILLSMEEQDLQTPCCPWFSRVPSPSNISDGPSRGKWSEVFSLGVRTKEVHDCLFMKKAMKVFDAGDG